MVFFTGIERSICIWKSQRIWCASFPQDVFWFVQTQFGNMVKFQFLAQFQMITFFIQSCLVLYYSYANLLHSLIMWLTLSALSPYDLDFLFCCVLSNFALTSLVLIALLCVAIRKDSVSLLRFPFLSHVQVFSCEILSVCRLKYPYSCFSFSFLFPCYCCSLDQYAVCSFFWTL